MKRHVPDLHTDFIYSVGAEEYGLIFSLLLIALFGFIVVRGLYRAMKLTDPFEQVGLPGDDFLDQPELQEALADLADGAALQLGCDGKDRAIVARAGRR